MSEASWKSMSESILAMAKTGATADNDKTTMTVHMIAASRVVKGALELYFHFVNTMCAGDYDLQCIHVYCTNMIIHSGLLSFLRSVLNLTVSHKFEPKFVNLKSFAQ